MVHTVEMVMWLGERRKPWGATMVATAWRTAS